MKIEIMYFGRPSVYLGITSERIDISDEVCTLSQMLNNLRKRGARWAYELDGSHVVCTINQKYVEPSEALKNRDEIAIFSRKSWLTL